MEALLYLLMGFLSGSVPFSWFIGKLNGVDLRTQGSGNPGATNLLRSAGTLPGVAGMLLDTAKGAFPVFIASTAVSAHPWLTSAVALAAVSGHVFMPWFGFRGGKGVATALGALLVLAPFPVLVSLGLFVVLVALFRMVSLGSVVAGMLLPIGGVFFHESVYPEVVLVVIAVAILVTHRHNIKRILSGTERKIGGK